MLMGRMHFIRVWHHGLCYNSKEMIVCTQIIKSLNFINYEFHKMNILLKEGKKNNLSSEGNSAHSSTQWLCVQLWM